MSEIAKPLILTLDDDQDMLNLNERILKNSGYDVITADRASKAFVILEKVKPDLILLDVMMPEMNGYEFCTHLQQKKEFTSIPVVFLTALKEEQDKARAFAAGGVDFLTKPINKVELVAVVEKHLNTKRQWMKLEKTSVPIERKKFYPDFQKFKEFLVENLKLTFEKREKISNLGISQLYSIPSNIGITNRQLAMLVAEFLGCSYTPFIDPENVNLGTFPMPFCRANSCVAIVDDSGKNIFVLSNPFKMELMSILEVNYKVDKESNLSITEPDNIDLLLAYSSEGTIEHGMISEDKVLISKPGEGEKKKKGVKPLEGDISEWEIERHPVVHIANNLIYRAVNERASDIHIEPKETNSVVRFRIDGDMRDMFTLQKKTSIMLISRYKILGNMNIAEKRRSQDGAFEAMVGNRTFKLRLATTSTPYGESIIMRLLEPTAKPRDLKELGMTDKQVETMINFSNRHQGFVLIVGATGSGKSTTIYSLLSHIDCSTRSLISVEDPVEYTIPFANQQQVNVKAGITFESLLKSSVRQDPDILFIGEIRDPESASIAVDFASTGHLTISTMHSANATTAIFRLERLGISRWIMADAILGIVSQRLMRKLCPHCKKIVPISKEEIEMLSPFTDDVPSEVAHPSGCVQCNGSGYLGREAVYEIMEFDQEISEMVRSNTPIQEIRSFIKKRGDYLMSDHAVEKVKKFIFSPKDAYEKILVEDTEFGVRRPIKEEQQVPLASEKPSKKISILVVEDDEDTQKLVARYLENEGYEVAIARDGIEALLSLGSRNFDLILSDIDLPNLDGLKLLEMMNQKGIETPVIFLTAHTDEQTELKGFELGATGYIKKPIQKEMLLLRIKRVLKNL